MGMIGRWTWRGRQLCRVAAVTVWAAAGLLVVPLGAAARHAPGTPPPAFTPAPLPAGTPRADRPLQIVATTPLLADLVRQVGGERVEVKAILPANADPHDYEPDPRDLVAIEDADAIFEHGLN